jgi:hypothetical protein
MARSVRSRLRRLLPNARLRMVVPKLTVFMYIARRDWLWRGIEHVVPYMLGHLKDADICPCSNDDAGIRFCMIVSRHASMTTFENPVVLADSRITAPNFAWVVAAMRPGDSIRYPKYMIHFPVVEGAGDHCEMGNRSLLNRRVLDWLSDTLQV